MPILVGIGVILEDDVHPLERIVDAHRRVETGHERGSVVATLGA